MLYVECLQHMDLCRFYWMCGSTYDAAMYYALPPHTCPVPPPGTTPPPPPGKCVFNMEASKCKFTGKGQSLNGNLLKTKGNYSVNSSKVVEVMGCRSSMATALVAIARGPGF